MVVVCGICVVMVCVCVCVCECMRACMSVHMYVCVGGGRRGLRLITNLCMLTLCGLMLFKLFFITSIKSTCLGLI